MLSKTQDKKSFLKNTGRMSSNLVAIAEEDADVTLLPTFTAASDFHLDDEHLNESDQLEEMILIDLGGQ